MLTLVTGLSKQMNLLGPELLHLVLQPLLKVGLTLPVCRTYQPYKLGQATGTHYRASRHITRGACPRRYRAKKF